MRRTFRGSVTERALVKKGSEPTLGAFNMEARERLKEGYAVQKLRTARILQKEVPSGGTPRGTLFCLCNPVTPDSYLPGKD